MKSNTQSAVRYAAASAAGREPVNPVPQINPIVALAASVLGPILGFVRRRATPPPMAVRKVRLESYSSSPVTPPSAPRTRHPAHPLPRQGMAPGTARGRAGQPPTGGHSHG